MVQVKVFQEKTFDLKVFQGAVNQFLQEHAQDIKVIDIKYTAEVVILIMQLGLNGLQWLFLKQTFHLNLSFNKNNI